jgi:hypothetical protein
MTSEPRAALDRLIAALEAHLAAASQRQGERDPDVLAAYTTLADAFEAYDEALYDAYDEVTPFILYDEAEDEADDDEDDLLDEEDLALDLGDADDLTDDDEDDELDEAEVDDREDSREGSRQG